MTVLLVRHASAGDRHRWEGRDEDRPLDGAGRAQAQGLVEALAGFEISRIVSSPYLRCTETVHPLAAARGLAVEPSDELAEGAGRVAVRRVERLLDGPAVVLCTHGDVVEQVLDDLGVERRDETEKGATWVLGLGQARGIPPPA